MRGEGPVYDGIRNHRLRPAVAGVHRAPPAAKGLRGLRAAPYLAVAATIVFLSFSVVVGFHAGSSGPTGHLYPLSPSEATLDPVAGSPLPPVDPPRVEEQRADRSKPSPPEEPPAAQGRVAPAPGEAAAPLADRPAPAPVATPTPCPPPLPAPTKKPRPTPPKGPKVAGGPPVSVPQLGRSPTT